MRNKEVLYVDENDDSSRGDGVGRRGTHHQHLDIGRTLRYTYTLSRGAEPDGMARGLSYTYEL